MSHYTREYCPICEARTDHEDGCCIVSDYVRFGFPPEFVEERECYEGQPIWYTGASGKGKKPV